MEGAREFQISVEYQIYCLFYFFDSWLKFKIPIVKYSNKFKWQVEGWWESFPLSSTKIA